MVVEVVSVLMSSVMVAMFLTLPTSGTWVGSRLSSDWASENSSKMSSHATYWHALMHSVIKILTPQMVVMAMTMTKMISSVVKWFMVLLKIIQMFGGWCEI